ncbi:Hepatocyte growth factor-like protein [Seminavis robusta]|uniref:Hepatocyte growth factor-like protein n=1 Tax=Seminavis robusta TaxID=568900 RepID=A0A9N8EQD6_9STRA|nr:Hepatocyte growth factor-like protein [Seminavis robusta]|eukprot:Sro1597_g284870.1 Hepatocyte growth factor-like protein (1002) ;mRNA; r:8091-11789
MTIETSEKSKTSNIPTNGGTPAEDRTPGKVNKSGESVTGEESLDLETEKEGVQLEARMTVKDKVVGTTGTAPGAGAGDVDGRQVHVIRDAKQLEQDARKVHGFRDGKQLKQDVASTFADPGAQSVCAPKAAEEAKEEVDEETGERPPGGVPIVQRRILQPRDAPYQNAGAYAVDHPLATENRHHAPRISDTARRELEPSAAMENLGQQGMDSSVSQVAADAEAQQMLRATLVEEDDGEIVYAKPALDGFQALIHNPKSKWVLLAIVLIILAIVIPVALLAPSASSREDDPDNLNVTCGFASAWQANYQGNLNVTESGASCQTWESATSFRPEKYESLALDLDTNYCRNPNGEKRAWCFTNDPEWEFCAVPNCPAEFDHGVVVADAAKWFANDEGTPEISTLYTPQDSCGTAAIRQYDYRGTINVSKSGRPCQPWSDQDPHGHSRHPWTETLAGLRENFCRNPDGELTAWCYTADPNLRWELCDVPVCESREKCGSAAVKQDDYRGNISITENGHTCQRWDSDSPHNHGYLGDERVDGLEENYCRNPKAVSERAWCFTTNPNVRRDFCSVPYCQSASDASASNIDFDYGFNFSTTCGTMSLQQRDYRGFVNVTRSGKPCLEWSNLPVETGADIFVTLRDHETHYLGGLDGPGNNFCRNPFVVGHLLEETGHKTAFCVNTDGIREDCDVPTCEDDPSLFCGSFALAQSNYRGTVNITFSGLTCQRWDSISNESFVEKYENWEKPWVPHHDPFSALEENYCRRPIDLPNALKLLDPRGERRAWCFTTSPSVPVEFCDVPYCEETNSPHFIFDYNLHDPCFNCSRDQCGTSVVGQRDYLGAQNVTLSGKACRPWKETPYNFSVWNDDGYLTANYCRSPSTYNSVGETGQESAVSSAGCFTTGAEAEWESCGIPYCSDEWSVSCGSHRVKQRDYRGSINATETGKPCKPWSSEGNLMTPDSRPLDGLSSNFCRNPGGFEKAWCYVEPTNDGDPFWEYCRVPLCPRA